MYIKSKEEMVIPAHKLYKKALGLQDVTKGSWCKVDFKLSAHGYSVEYIKNYDTWEKTENWDFAHTLSTKCIYSTDACFAVDEVIDLMEDIKAKFKLPSGAKSKTAYQERVEKFLADIYLEVAALS